MDYKVVTILIFFGFISCNNSDSKRAQDQTKNGYVQQLKPKKGLSYEEQIAELSNIFIMAQTSEVPEDILDITLAGVTNKNLSDVKAFIHTYTTDVPRLISDNHLKKPDKGLLEVMYKLHKIGEVNYRKPTANPRGIIEHDHSNVNSYDLLYNYYNILFKRLNKSSVEEDYAQYNIDYDRLNITSPEDKAILYYTSMTFFGSRFVRLARTDCDAARDFGDNMPLYEGKSFYNYVVPEYQSFDIVFGNKKELVSIENAIGRYADNALISYNNCNK
jgi:hypothetical protein